MRPGRTVPHGERVTTLAPHKVAARAKRAMLQTVLRQVAAMLDRCADQVPGVDLDPFDDHDGATLARYRGERDGKQAGFREAARLVRERADAVRVLP